MTSTNLTKRRNRRIGIRQQKKRVAKENDKTDWNFEVVNLLSKAGGRKRKEHSDCLIPQSDNQTTGTCLAMSLDTQAIKAVTPAPIFPTQEPTVLDKQVQTRELLFINEEVFASSIAKLSNED